MLLTAALDICHEVPDACSALFVCWSSFLSYKMVEMVQVTQLRTFGLRSRGRKYFCAGRVFRNEDQEYFIFFLFAFSILKWIFCSSVGRNYS